MKTLLDYLQEKQIFVNALCNGNGTCGKCKVKVQGIEPNEKDLKILTKKEIEDGYILACSHEYSEDIIIGESYQSGEILTTFDTQIQGINENSGYGIIVDIGTTTLVFNLINKASGEVIETKSTYNPQISYGGDVITRIQYDTKHPHILTKCIRECILNQIQSWLNFDIRQMILTGNTTMIHIFNDINTKPIGEAPFDVPEMNLVKANAKDIFDIEYDFEVITLPHISAYVGSDIVTGMYALECYNDEDTFIFLDMGTNGEIVAGNKHGMHASSSAAGPAFEGGGIECGGASIDGAIYKVEDKDGILKLHTINDKVPTCICGTGLISLIAYLRKNEIINELGRFEDGSKKFDLTENIYVSNKDIQNFLLAKAAMQTALEVMTTKYSDVKHVYISGGFGNKLDLDDLVTLQIISQEIKEKVVIKKNTALEGTYKLLMTQDYDALHHMIDKIESIDLSTYEDFEDMLIESLFI